MYFLLEPNKKTKTEEGEAEHARDKTFRSGVQGEAFNDVDEEKTLQHETHHGRKNKKHEHEERAPPTTEKRKERKAWETCI